MSSVSGSASTNTGTAPSRHTASAVAMKVLAGSTTSSPGPTDAARNAISSASVPFATPTQCSTPQKRAYASSKVAT